MSLQNSTQFALGYNCCLPKLLERAKFCVATIYPVYQRQMASITRCEVAMAERACNWLCCLCHRQFQHILSLKKRKRLHGVSCRNSKQLLEEVLSERLHLTLNSFIETRGTAAFLCNLCDSQVVSTYQGKIEDNIVEMASSLARSTDPRRKSAQATTGSTNRKKASIH